MKPVFGLLLMLGLVVGCGSGGGGSSDPAPLSDTPANVPAPPSGTQSSPTNTPPVNDQNSSVPTSPAATTPAVTEPSAVEAPQMAAGDNAFESSMEVARFLTQATFGPKPEEPTALEGTSASQWLVAEFNKPATLYVPLLEQAVIGGASSVFWRNWIEADDQLRQRMVYALSQIIVVSDFGGEVLTEVRVAVPYYQDVLAQNAFGNYRDLLEAITYTPAMGHYLTYLGNEKGDPETGRVPDENYAREILQLFTVGLLALNADGSLQRDENGNPIEIYDNSDITGLARVFTGLDFGGDREDLIDKRSRIFSGFGL